MKRIIVLVIVLAAAGIAQAKVNWADKLNHSDSIQQFMAQACFDSLATSCKDQVSLKYGVHEVWRPSGVGEECQLFEYLRDCSLHRNCNNAEIKRLDKRKWLKTLKS